MLSDPRAAFNIFLPRHFLYDKVIDRYKKYFEASHAPYHSIIDYINSTITNALIPGLADQGTQKQTFNRGRNKTFAGSISPLQTMDKTITISFALKNGFFNWAVLYQQTIAYLERKYNGETVGDVFMPDIFLMIVDDFDNAIMNFTFKQIQIRSISDISFSKTNIGVMNKTFDVVFNFNEMEFSFNMDDTIDYRNKDMEY